MGKALDEPTAPPGWTTTAEPMRIAILGWARLSLQVREGSGYNLSASELASGLSMTGHHVSYLASGIRFSLVPGPRVRPTERWRGVACFELVNSPNCAPSACNFKNVGNEMRSPRQARLVLRWLDAVRADAVHVHSLEGFGMDLIAAIRASGRPVVVTPHNYWFICPQVDLLHRETHLCEDYDGGRRCVGCLDSGAYWPQRFKRTLGQALESAFGPALADIVRKTSYGVVDRFRTNGRESNDERADHDEPKPDPELGIGFNVDDAAAHTGRIEHNHTLSPDDEPVELSRSPIDQNERFLQADVHLAVLNEYGRRRAAGVEALNHASLVTPPSDFVRRVYVRMGVEESRTRVVRLGQPHFDQINRRARRSPYYDTRPWEPRSARRPLRFVFFGTTRHNKGLDVLIRAIPLLDRDVRQRSQFLIRASGWDWPFRRRVAEYPEVQFAGGYDLLQLIGAWGEYDVGLLPHIWFENSPLVMLEHLHAGRMMIASRLGGPVEWIVEPGDEQNGTGEGRALRYNGLFFPGGDPEGLAERITQLVTGEIIIPSPREIHAATPILQSYPDHIAEVESIYRELLAGA
ncbi:MAG: glycosyltransferase [Planctomycetes bacterium]|nr:glycosyltransferase [Planctomycetota bacterium]